MANSNFAVRYITVDEVEQDPDALKVMLKIHREMLLVNDGVVIAELLPVDCGQDARPLKT